MASSKLWSSSLPTELLEDIFCRIPIDSLVRCKSVCKQWYTLLNDKSFIYKLLDLSTELFIRPDHHPVKIFEKESEDKDGGRPSISSVHPMVHCDGLLLCRCITVTYVKVNWLEYKENTHEKLVVWNPFLRQIKWIELTSVIKDYMHDIFGFGYDNVSRDNYKILRYKCQEKPQVEIYEFKSKLWRSVDATCYWTVYQRCKAVSMNGNMYWVAQNTCDKSFFIQSFDFSSETFKPICCLPFELAQVGIKIFFSGFRGDRLSLLHIHEQAKIDVWVTNKVTDEVVSWSKYVYITRHDDYCFSYKLSCSVRRHFDNTTNYMIEWCEGVYAKRSEYIDANFYELLKCEIRKLVVRRRRTWVLKLPSQDCCAYVPSLVPVP